MQDTPQVINVITQQQLEQRAVTNLSEVITRVPGVTMSAGEGGGGMGVWLKTERNMLVTTPDVITSAELAYIRQILEGTQ